MHIRFTFYNRLMVHLSKTFGKTLLSLYPMEYLHCSFRIVWAAVDVKYRSYSHWYYSPCSWTRSDHCCLPCIQKVGTLINWYKTFL